MVWLTDRPNMTLDVYRGRKTTTQQLGTGFIRRWRWSLIYVRSCIVSLVIIARVHLFNAESINELHKRPLPGLTIGLGQVAGEK